MISANEELQSTNEELQSLNEELHTVSAEHQLKIKELIELNDDLNNYFTSSEIGQILIDRNMIVRKFSPAITKHVNLIESDIGRPIMDITNNIKEIDLISDIRKVMLTGDYSKREISLPDGKAFLMKLNPYVRQDKSLDGVVVNFIDITEMKQLTSIIEGVFNSSTSGITVKRPVRNKESVIIDFEYQAANNAAEKIFGVAFGLLSGRWLLRDFSIEKNYFQRYVRVIETGKDDHYEFFNEANSRWYDVVSVKMRDGVVTTFTDTTQKKKAADVIAKSFEDLKQTSNKLQETNYRLEQSNMDLLQFASVASHDLKEPLRKIQTFGNILYSKIENKLEANEKGYLDKIINSSHRMQVLIEDVLTLSKLSNTDLPFEKTDLQSVIKHIMEDLEITIRDKGTEVNVGNLPIVEAVPGQMHQLFQNLISNALKFNESTVPMIRIQPRDMHDSEAEEYDVDRRDFVGICVEDNGIGFDEKYKEKIFGIFQRLHGTATYQGTGIGLAICKKIVDNHHGFIKAESKLGHGSSFIIFLPAEQTLKIGSNGNGKPHSEKVKSEQSTTS
jgi:two-component system CheB/CheR fusion protein